MALVPLNEKFKFNEIVRGDSIEHNGLRQRHKFYRLTIDEQFNQNGMGDVPKILMHKT